MYHFFLDPGSDSVNLLLEAEYNISSFYLMGCYLDYTQEQQTP